MDNESVAGVLINESCWIGSADSDVAQEVQSVVSGMDHCILPLFDKSVGPLTSAVLREMSDTEYTKAPPWVRDEYPSWEQSMREYTVRNADVVIGIVQQDSEEASEIKKQLVDASRQNCRTVLIVSDSDGNCIRVEEDTGTQVGLNTFGSN